MITLKESLSYKTAASIPDMINVFFFFCFVFNFLIEYEADLNVKKCHTEDANLPPL